MIRSTLHQLPRRGSAWRVSNWRWRCRDALAALAIGVAGLIAVPLPASALTVTIDTATLAGNAGRLEFDLFDGDLSANNTVTISNVVTDGVAAGATCLIGCSGAFVLDDSVAFGQLLWDLALGTYVRFDLSYSGDFSGLGVRDRLVLFLLDANTNLTLVDTDLDALSDPIPYQDALLVVDLGATTPPLFPTSSNPRVEVSSIPEPGTLALALISLALLAGRRVPTRRPADAG